LAFIFYCTKIHGVAPAEVDMESYFKVSSPSVHQMVLGLKGAGSADQIVGCWNDTSGESPERSP